MMFITSDQIYVKSFRNAPSKCIFVGRFAIEKLADVNIKIKCPVSYCPKFKDGILSRNNSSS
jgi:hypothetical protein